MRDLELWRRLLAYDFQAPHVLEGLRELASWPLPERWPFLGFVPTMLRHADPEVRRAAVTALSGTYGHLATKLLVAALYDGEENVRLAAVEALRDAAGQHDWGRFTHALYHPDPVIRRAAVEPERPCPGPDCFLLYLMPDEACTEAIRTRLDEMTPPVTFLPLLFELTQAGALPRPLAARMAARLRSKDAWEFLYPLRARTEEDSVQVLAALERPDGAAVVAAHSFRDSLDDFIDLFWDEGATDTAKAFFERVLLRQLKLPGPDRRRVVAARVVTGVRRGLWLIPAAGTCAVLHPPFLVCPWIPRAVRRAALATLYDLSGQCPNLTDEEVRRLLRSDLARTPDGRLDLWALGALLHFFSANPYQRLFNVHDVSEVVRAIQDDMEQAVPFLSLPDNSPRGRRLLIREMCSQPHGQRASLLAMLARAVPSDALDFLNGLDGRTACLLFEQLQADLTPPARVLPDNKKRKLADLLAPKIAAGQIGLFLRLWLDMPAPEASELGLILLTRLAREHAPHLLRNAIRSLELERLRKLLSVSVHCAGFPYALELELAEQLAEYSDPAIRAWCTPRLARLAASTKSVGKFRVVGADEDQAPQLKLGLCAKLRDQPDPAEPDLDVCLALLGSHDPLAEVDAQFHRFSSTEAAFVTRLDQAAIAIWQGEHRLPLVGHAWLYRWDRHVETFGELVLRDAPAGIVAGVIQADALTSPLLRLRFWEVIANLLMIWRWRTPARLEPTWNAELGIVLVEALSTPVAAAAARMLLLWHETGHVPHILGLLRPRLVEKLLDASEEVRTSFASWVDMRGAAPVAAPPPAPAPAVQVEAEQAVDACADPAVLAEWACQPYVAELAARKLVQLGTPGCERLAALLHLAPPAGTLKVLAATVTDWPEGPTLAALRQAVLAGRLPPETCFRVGQALVMRGVRPSMARLAQRLFSGALLSARGAVPSLEEVFASDDLDFLTAWANYPHILPTFKAIHRLLQLGTEGMDRLRLLLLHEPPLVWTVRGLQSLADNSGPVQDAARHVLYGQRLESEELLADALLADPELLAAMLDAVCRPEPVSWFQSADWFWVSIHCPDLHQASIQLVRAPHPQAYTPATRMLRDTCKQATPEVRDALLGFLNVGTERLREARQQAAAWLARHGHAQHVLPLLLQGEPKSPPLYPEVLSGASPRVVEVVVTAGLLANWKFTVEDLLVHLLKAGGVDPLAREEAYTKLLLNADSNATRHEVRQQMRPSRSRSVKLRRVAETFAWGIRTCRELTGKLFSIEMIAGDELGYTRFNQNRLYITPAPLLRGDPNAKEVVRALILHEVGHHLYHRGPDKEKVWKQAQDEDMHPLLNLVSDEHLERNLRALDRGFGDQLKLLGAFAFQHNDSDYDVETLLTALQGRAFEVLVRSALGVSRRPGRVTVQSGRLLMAMEKAGLSFPRFVRALRMGLGNRHGDPKVAAGLALFRGKFRTATMPALLAIAHQLRDIFGQETDLLKTFDPEASVWIDADELERLGDGLTNEEVQSEVRRVLEGRKGGAKSGRGGAVLNVGPEEDFPPITTIVPIPHDAATHAEYAQRVGRAARKMRRYFQELGLHLRPQRFRLRGKSFDRTRARAVVLRGDPRMLVARELERYTDLFIGVLVDCSGSMAHDANIEKAKLFGTLLAEAAKGCPGIDVRLFGFTDSVIYDAGHADRCAVHGLESDGGNNDAAGLWHAALAARASRRKAKLLVMISDGLPTECSVTALRALVERLTRRWKICCAQVAVRALEEVCFPNYILLEDDDGDPTASVPAFGQVAARLVRKALGGG